MPEASTAAQTVADGAVLGERAFAALDPAFPERMRPAGHTFADLVFQLLLDQAERGGGTTVLKQGPRLDRVCLTGRLDLEELAADLETFFD